VKDAGEPGLVGWRIRLALNGVPTDSMLTDGAGNYTFAALTAGTYTVSEASQSGWVRTAPPGGSYTISVTSGSNVSSKDFGNFQLGSIAGTKFNDLNGNGARDLDEPGISSWRIRLSRGGIQVDSALTDGTGGYSFAGLIAGTYTVSEVLQSGWITTAPA